MRKKIKKFDLFSGFVYISASINDLFCVFKLFAPGVGLDVVQSIQYGTARSIVGRLCNFEVEKLLEKFVLEK